MNAIHGVGTLALFELRNATRTRWFPVAGVVFASAAVAVAFAGLRSLSSLGLAGAGAATDGLVHLTLLLPPLIGLLLGAGTLARDRERGMLAMFAAQPLRRGTLPLAMFVGSLFAAWAVIAVGLGVALVVIAAVMTFGDLAAFGVLMVVGLATTASAVALGVTLSAFSTTHHQATAAAASVWLILALGMDLLFAGAAPGLRLGASGLLAAVLINPLEAGRVLALLLLDGAGSLGPFDSYLTQRFGLIGTRVLLGGSLVFWIVAPLVVARWWIYRRDI